MVGTIQHGQAVRARLSSQQIHITLPSGNMSLVDNSLNTNMSTVYSKVGAGVSEQWGFPYTCSSPVSSLILRPISLRNARVREPTASSDSNVTQALVVSYFFFETIPPLLLVGLQVEATTSNRTAHF